MKSLLRVKHFAHWIPSGILYVFWAKKGTFFKNFKIQKRDLFSPKRPFLSKKGTFSKFKKGTFLFQNVPFLRGAFKWGIYKALFEIFFLERALFCKMKPQKKVPFWGTILVKKVPFWDFFLFFMACTHGKTRPHFEKWGTFFEVSLWKKRYRLKCTKVLTRLCILKGPFDSLNIYYPYGLRKSGFKKVQYKFKIPPPPDHCNRAVNFVYVFHIFCKKCEQLSFTLL